MEEITMCLAIPMQIAALTADGKAVVRRDDLETEVDISLIEKPALGDYVIVHAGYAIEVLDLQEAEERLEMFRAISEAAERADET
jgi:hydrogenase expression/formation protein HypC